MVHRTSERLKAMAESVESRLVELVFPAQANHHGTLFAGNALGLMGKVAVVAASRRARNPVVMAASERVDFLEPVRVGELLDCVAEIERVGRTSMTVRVEAFAESLTHGERRLAIRGRFVMVAIDDDGRSVPVASTAP
jgi:acyl-CoA hydrolase